MSALDDVPANLNYLSPLNFKFTIRKSPHVNFFVQSCNIPGLTVESPNQGNPFIKIPKTGDHIDFEKLDISFKVDEKLTNYRELLTWIRGYAFPESHKQYADLNANPAYTGLGIYSDISIMVLSSSKNPMYECVIKDAFPIMLSSLIFDSTTPDVSYITARATFSFRDYTLTAV